VCKLEPTPDPKCPLEILPARVGVQTRLRAGRTRPRHTRQHRQTQSPRDRPGQFLGLIETAARMPDRVQGHGHDRVAVERRTSIRRNHERHKSRCDFEAAVKLEGAKRCADGKLVAERRDGAKPRRRPLPARRTKLTRRRRRCAPAATAGVSRQIPAAGCAQRLLARPGRHTAANAARRQEETLDAAPASEPVMPTVVECHTRESLASARDARRPKLAVWPGLVSNSRVPLETVLPSAPIDTGTSSKPWTANACKNT